MPKANNAPVTPPPTPAPAAAAAVRSKAKRKSNISLPERATPLEVIPSMSRRNTMTEDNVSKPRKKIKIPSTPTIPEDGTTDEVNKTASFVAVNENKKLNRTASDVSRVSSLSSKSTKTAYTYENKAYEGKIAESRNPSIRTTSRAPSVQSLEVYREQYCCCAKRTKCERSLLVTVTVLTVIIIVLVIVIVVLAKQNKLDTLFRL